MPSAQKMAAEKNIDTGSLSGTGRGGRVTKGDVIQAAEGGLNAGGSKAPAAASAPARAMPAVDLGDLGERPEQRVPMSRLRARVAERLLQSQSTNAILTTFNEINMAPVMDMRKRMQERFEKEHGVKLGFMSFFVKAAVHALKKFPVLNASVDGNDIVYHGYFDIGIAVGSPRGLVVPILRNADGSPHTAHTTNLVHGIYVAADADQFTVRSGILADIAPTLLDMLGVTQPAEMTGKTLLVRKA